MFTTGLNVILDHSGKLSVAAGIKSTVLENYSTANWLQKIACFFSALAKGKSVSAYLQGKAENELQAFIQCIGLIRKALCESDQNVRLNLPDGSTIEMEFYSLRSDGFEVLVDENESESEELLWVKNCQQDEWTTFPFSKSRLLELIDAEIAEHPATYTADLELVAACKVEHWYRKSTEQFSEFTSKGELKEPDAIFDHLLNPSNTGFHTNILEIQQSLLESGAYNGKTSQYTIQLQARHQARLETAVSIFINEQIDLLVYQGVTEENFHAVSTALKLISDNYAVIHGINRELTTKIKLLQSHYGQQNLAHLPIGIKQKALSKSIADQVEKEGLTDKNRNEYHTIHMLLLRSAIEKVVREGLTDENKDEFRSARESIDALPQSPDTALLKTIVSECLQKNAVTQQRRFI